MEQNNQTLEEMVEALMTRYKLLKQGLLLNPVGDTLQMQLPAIVETLNLPGIQGQFAKASENFNAINYPIVREAIELFIRRLENLQPGKVTSDGFTIKVTIK